MKRIFSMMLACILLLQAVPLTGFAAEQGISKSSIEEEDGIYYIQTFEDLKELASRTYEKEAVVTFRDCSQFTISESLSLPDALYFFAPESEIIIAKGAAFSTNRNLLANKLTVQGSCYLKGLQIYHTLTVTGKLYTSNIELWEEAASLDRDFDDVVIGASNINDGMGGIWVCPRITTTAELKTCINKANALASGNVYGVSLGGGDFVIDESVTTPKNLHMTATPLRGADSLTVSTGCTFTPNGGLVLECPLTVKGTLVNNNGIELLARSTSANGSLQIASGGAYAGEGTLRISGSADYRKHLTGIALDHYQVQTSSDGNSVELRYKTDKVKASASNVASSGKVKLSWAKISGAAEYQVYRATSEKGDYKLMKTTTSTTYTNTSAEAGKTYYYKVRGVTKSGKKLPYSDVVSRTCALPQPEVTTSNVSSSGKIKVSWEKVSGAAQYNVYRATSENGPYELMKTTTGTSYTNTSAKAGSRYYYKVRAIHSNSSANSAYSEIASRYCDLPRPVVKASNVSSSGKIKLTWDEVEGAKEYQVYRATSKSGEYKLVKTTTGTSYTNTSAKAGTKYYYKVKAIHSKSSANSAYSEAESRYCDLAKPVVTIKLKSGDPRLTWEKVDGAVEYQIYRATSKSGTYKLMKTTTGTSYTNTSAKSGKTYYYKVKAIHSNSNANSAYSLVDSIKAK